MPERILVVDDEPTIRALVCDILEDEGHEVVGTGNGAEAIAVLEQDTSFALIVLDAWMPVMNGWPFAAAMAERGISVPIRMMPPHAALRDPPPRLARQPTSASRSMSTSS